MKKQNDSNRPARIAAKVHQIVAEILREKYGDDEFVGGVSIVDAMAHGGGQFVKIFYYSHNDNLPAVAARLDEITRTVRYELAARMNQKYVPEIRFEYDDTLERAARIDQLLESIKDK